jgi:hypothetical protein
VSSAEKYVSAAYLVVLAVLLAYLALYAVKLSRLEREVSNLAELARRRREAPSVREPERENVVSR